MSTRLSPDGMYYWDGRQWLSTLSPDGRTRWNGTAWVSTDHMSSPPVYRQLQATMREPTSWTRPLQYAVVGFYALHGAYSFGLPYWMSGAFSQAMSQSLQRQQSLNPRVSPPPAEVASMMTSIMSVALWIAALVGLAISAVVIIGALKRWTWMFYFVLVLLGLGAISAPLNLISAATGSSIGATSGIGLPAWMYWMNAIVAISAAALFVWMLVALMKRGPWGMTKAAPS